MERTKTIHYQEIAMADLCRRDRELMEAAVAATKGAYAPYSHFSVGAAVRMASGAIVKGNNQENVAYPSGLCAERTALFAASATYPVEAIETLAVVGRDAKGELVSAMPCGACRQVMAEYESRQQCEMRVLAFHEEGKILLFEGVKTLLPFVFSM